MSFSCHSTVRAVMKFSLDLLQHATNNNLEQKTGIQKTTVILYHQA